MRWGRVIDRLQDQRCGQVDSRAGVGPLVVRYMAVCAKVCAHPCMAAMLSSHSPPLLS